MLLLVGCTERVLFVDPPVVYDSLDAGAIDEGDPAITVGIFEEQFFTPLEPAAELPIVAGFQGGTWVMPAIRAVALRGAVNALGVVVVDATGEEVGRVEDPQARLQATAAAYTELVALPVPIVHAAPNEMTPITDLYGQMATLSITVTDRTGRTASSVVKVRLVEG